MHACRLPEAALQRMAAEMAPLTVFPGQDLSHQGEAADRIFVLAEGRVPPCRQMQVNLATRARPLTACTFAL